MYKIFTRIINKRHYDWEEAYNKIKESQAGFCHGYSADETMLCLQAMIQKFLIKERADFIAYTSI